MKAIDRNRMVESIRTHLSSMTYFEFDAFPVNYQKHLKARGLPAHAYQFYPKCFHPSYAGQYDRKSLGFVVEMGRSEKQKRQAVAEILFGFEIVHHPYAALNLKKRLRSQTLKKHLAGLNFGQLDFDDECSEADPESNFGVYRRRDSHIFLCSGFGTGQPLNLNTNSSWELIQKKYPWSPGKESLTKNEKSYFSIIEKRFLPVRPAEINKTSKLIARTLLKKWAPLIEAVSLPRTKPILSRRTHSTVLRNAIAKVSINNEIRCAVDGASVGIDMAHIVPWENFVDCHADLIDRLDSPANVLPLCKNCHNLQERVELWHIGTKGRVFRADGTIVKLKYLSAQHKSLLRDFRAKAKIKAKFIRRLNIN